MALSNVSIDYSLRFRVNQKVKVHIQVNRAGSLSFLRKITEMTKSLIREKMVNENNRKVAINKYLTVGTLNT